MSSYIFLRNLYSGVRVSSIHNESNFENSANIFFKSATFILNLRAILVILSTSWFLKRNHIFAKRRLCGNKSYTLWLILHKHLYYYDTYFYDVSKNVTTPKTIIRLNCPWHWAVIDLRLAIGSAITWIVACCCFCQCWYVQNYIYDLTKLNSLKFE